MLQHVPESRSFLWSTKWTALTKFGSDVYEFYNLGIGDPVSDLCSVHDWDSVICLTRW